MVRLAWLAVLAFAAFGHAGLSRAQSPGVAAYEAGDHEAARTAFAAAIGSSADAPARARALNNEAIAAMAIGDLAGAEKGFDAALALLGGQESEEARTVRGNRAVLRARTGHAAEARAAQALIVASREATLGANDPRTLNALNNQVAAQWRDNALEDAVVAIDALAARTAGSDTPVRAAILGNQAAITAGTLRGARALGIGREALRIAEAARGKTHPDTILALVRVAKATNEEAIYGSGDKSRGLYAEAIARSLTGTPAAPRDVTGHVSLLDPGAPLLEVSDRIAGGELLGWAEILGQSFTRLPEGAPAVAPEALRRAALKIRARHDALIGYGGDYRNFAYELRQKGDGQGEAEMLALAMADYRIVFGLGDRIVLGDTVARYVELLRSLGRAADADAVLAEQRRGEPLAKQMQAADNAAAKDGLTLEQRIAAGDAVLAIARSYFGADSYRVAGLEADKAYLLQLAGRQDEAARLLDAALATVRRVAGDRHETYGNILFAYAQLLANADRAAEALPLMREGIRLSGEGKMYTGNDRIGPYIDLLLQTGDTAAALSWADWQLERRAAQNAQNRAIEVESRRLMAQGQIVSPFFTGENFSIEELMDKARALIALGRAAEAVPIGAEVKRRAAELYKKSFDQYDAAHVVGLTLFHVGRFAEAEAEFDRARKILAEFGNSVNAASEREADLWLARARIMQAGRAGLAYDTLKPVLAVRNRPGIGGSGGPAATLALHRLIADAAWSRGGDDPAMRAEGFASVQAAMAGAATQAVAQTAARRAAEAIGPELGALATEREMLGNRISAQDRELVALQNSTESDAETQRNEIRARIASLEARRSEIDVRLRTGAPAFFDLINPSPMTIADAQALLAADEAALLLAPTPLGTHAIVVTREGLHWHRAPIDAAQVDATVKTLRASLDQAIDERTKRYLKPFDRSAAYTLYEALILPAAPVLAGKTHLYVAASGSLASLPLSVLPTRAPTGDDRDPTALRGEAWLADAFAIVQIPSLQSLKLLRARPARTDTAQARSFDGFGDPVLAPPGDDGDEIVEVADVFATGRNADGSGIANISELKLLASLPGTGVELENLRKGLAAPPDAVRLQAAATETAVKRADLARTRVLAFATHGLVAGEVEGAAEPGLVFTPPEQATPQDDGLLTLSEITTLKLDADWVILSACNTASGDSSGATGLSGLARAFFYAGARTLLASHWPVRDDVAATITVDTIARQSPTVSRAQAFQAAMKAIRDDPADPAKAHPAAWAPFILVGDR